MQTAPPTRVLLSAYACAPNYGTEPGNGWNWALHLAERGMDVHVLAEAGAQSAIEGYLRSHPELPVRFTFVRARPHLLCRFSSLRYLFWQSAAVRAARVLHKAKPFDLVHHVTFGSIHIPTQLWRLGIPTVFGPVGGGNTAPPSLLPYFGGAALRERLRSLSVRMLPFSPLHRRAYKQADRLLGTNLETLAVFQAMGRPDVQLLLDAGLPDSFFAPGPWTLPNSADRPLRILWVGRLLPRKGLLLTLDVLARVRAPFTLTILGSGMGEQQVRSAIRERGLEDRVVWKAERASWEQVREAYGEHDCLLFTSLRESFGAQLLEAMAAGLPVLCLDTSGARDFVPQAASLKVPVFSAEQVRSEMAAAIERFAGFPAARRLQMSQAGLDAARAHTWRKRAAFADELYTQLLARTHKGKAGRRILSFPANPAQVCASHVNPARKGFGG